VIVPQRVKIRVAAEFHDLFHQLGFGETTAFKHPNIKPWRKLPDRENCTWDVKLADGQSMRFHVKRYLSTTFVTPADEEAKAYRALEAHKIPTAKLVAWGSIGGTRSFVIIQDLAGFEAADKLIERGFPFARLLDPTADLVAKLHTHSLHHRDLYLCHFFVKADADTVDLRLIDAARVARLINPLTRRRWIVKDLAQFWYSTLALPVIDAQRNQWLERYAEQSNMKDVARLKQSIERKSKSIAAHDAKLRKKQPKRNISIPKA
jgi:hypothetical protein